jgi:invasion protein IalB
MTFSKAKTSLLAVLTGALLLGAAPATAAKTDPRILGTFKDWSAYTWVEEGQKICYMLSRPLKSVPTNVRRGDIYLMITYRPKSRINEEVSHVTGYPYKDKSVVDVTIDKRKFKMATDGDAAWLPGADMDAKMINAMRRGSKMTIKGTSSRGTDTTDTYSLQGFTAAHKQIRKSCN